MNEVSHTACNRLAELLARTSGPEAFSASATTPSGSLPLEVRGVGPIKLPVSQIQAKQLCLPSLPRLPHAPGNPKVVYRFRSTNKNQWLLAARKPARAGGFGAWVLVCPHIHATRMCW